MEVFREREEDIIDPNTEMHYAILSSFSTTKFPHSHDFFEFFLLVEGTQELVINGQTLTLEPGSLMLIRPNDIHSRRYIKSGRHINIAFSSEIASALFAYLGDGYQEELLDSSHLPPFTTLNKAESSRIQSRMNELYAISLRDTRLQRIKLRALIADICANYLVRSIPSFPGNINNVSTRYVWFDHLLEVFEQPENLAEGLSALLRISGKSHEYLCRVFRETLNCTPTQYINDLRINYAANYLIHTDMTILDICMAAGFENLSHFYHLFSKKYSMTPKQFRLASIEQGIFQKKNATSYPVTTDAVWHDPF